MKKQFETIKSSINVFIVLQKVFDESIWSV